MLQKNHDFDLQVPTDLPGVTYVIQYRNPVMAVLSDREYLARLEGRSRADDVAEYEVWLGKRGAHFKRFWDKWLARRNDRHIVIEYSELQRNPSAALEQVLRGVGVAIDAHRVEAAVRDVSGIVADFPVHSPAMPYSPRVMKDSQYFDPALMSVYESMLLETIPGLESTGLLQRTGPVDHPTRLVYQAALSTAAGAPDEAVAALKKAAQIAPHNPYVWEDLSLASLQVNDQEQAIAAASEALKLRPRNTILLRLVSDLYSLRAKADLDRAVTVARTLLELSPVDPGHLVHLASLLVRRREYVEAGGLAAQAMSNNPGDAFVWRECSEVLAITGDRAGALDAMKEALIRLPTNAEFHHHLGNLLVEGGDLAGAICRRRAAGPR